MACSVEEGVAREERYVTSWFLEGGTFQNSPGTQERKKEHEDELFELEIVRCGGGHPRQGGGSELCFMSQTAGKQILSSG